MLEKEASAIAPCSEGSGYDAIAKKLGYASRASAWEAVDRGLRAERDERAGATAFRDAGHAVAASRQDAPGWTTCCCPTRQRKTA